MSEQNQDPQMIEDSKLELQAESSQEKKRTQNRTYTIIAVLLLVSFLTFGFLFVRETLPYWQGNAAYADMSKKAVKVKTLEPGAITTALAQNYPQSSPTIPGSEPSGLSNMAQTPVPTLTADQLDLLRINAIIEIDFNYLKSINPDIVGWIFSEGTNINYPILLGPDNYYYLARLADKTPNRLGSIFMEHNNKPDFSDDTTVLFGHNMRDDSMFASLEYYRKQEYYDEHPFLYIFTPEHTFRVDLFAGYVVEARDIESLHQNMESIEELQAFVADSIARSTFKSDLRFEDDDRFVSLFTCNYDYTDSRYVVQGKLVQLTP